MNKVLNIIFNIIEGSVFFRFVDRIIDFFSRLIRSSFFYAFFTKKPNYDYLHNNIIYKLHEKVFCFFDWIGEKFFIDLIGSSKIFQTIYKIDVGEILSSSKGFNFIANIFDFDLKEIRLCDCILLAIIFLAPFLPTMVVAGMLFVNIVIYFFNVAMKKGYTLKFDYIWLFIFIYMVITCFYGVTSLDFASSIKIAMLTSMFMFSYYLIISIIDTRGKINLVVFTFVTSSFFVGLYGVYQKVSGQIDTTWTDSDLFQGLSLRVTSTFGNPNVFGEYLLLVIPIALIMIYFSKNLWAKLYYLGVSSVLILNLGLTYSRGCYLALLVGLFFFVITVEKKLIVLFSFGIFLLPFVIPESMLLRFASILNFQDSSTSYRIMIWQGTMRILENFWYIGLGQGSTAFNTVYPLYGFNGIYAPHAHNVFFQVFVETGIGGFVAFMGILFAYMKTSISFTFKNMDYKYKFLVVALICGFISFFVQGIFDYVFYNYRVFLLFFITMGICGSIINLMKDEVAYESN